MKVLLINGSPRPNGNTSLALREMESVFKAESIETETIQIGNKPIRGCIACGQCAEKGRCVFDDAVNEIAPKFEAADGLVVGSPGRVKRAVTEEEIRASRHNAEHYVEKARAASGGMRRTEVR